MPRHEQVKEVQLLRLESPRTAERNPNRKCSSAIPTVAHAAEGAGVALGALLPHVLLQQRPYVPYERSHVHGVRTEAALKYGLRGGDASTVVLWEYL